jgi:serine phosphatase RsbU (regulator of sigma subunit)/Tfp pilus assembly protein PilF
MCALNYRVVLVFLFLCLNGYTQSDSYLDSLWKIWDNPKNNNEKRLKALSDYSWEGYLYSMPDSAFYFAELQYKFAASKKMIMQMADARNTQGASFFLKSDFINAIKYYTEALKLFQEINYEKGISNSYNNLGLIHADIGDNATAIQYYNKSLKYDEKINNKDGISASYNNIGLIYKHLGKPDKAIEYFNKSINLKKEINDESGIASTLNNIGLIFQERGDVDSALHYIQMSMNLELKHNNKLGISGSLSNLGNIFADKKLYNQAIEKYKESLQLQSEIGDIQGMSNTLNCLGEIYRILGDYKKSIMYSSEAYDKALKIGSIAELKVSAKSLYEVYKLVGDTKNSLEMHENYILYKDSINSENNQIEVMRQEITYEFDKKVTADSIMHAKQIELNDVQIAKQNAEMKVKQNQQYALFGGLFLVIVFSIFIFNRFKITQRQKEIIEIQKKEVELQREIALEQKNIVEEKNQEISDSINYAKRIQEAILPSRYSLVENLKNGFVLFKPKDIVSGDFYWLETTTPLSSSIGGGTGEVGEVYFAAADCTGHGVPGAMVSVICSNALSKALLEEGITETGKLLDRTRELVIERFSKSDEEVKDGMDISLCKLKGNILEWSGANNPLWVINPKRSAWPLTGIKILNEMETQVGFEVKANAQPIGNFDFPTPFATHRFELNKGDTIYIFTDGFHDQFGGAKGKKLKSSMLRKKLISIYDMDMDEQKNQLEQLFYEWRGDHEQIDDICIIGVRI